MTMETTKSMKDLETMKRQIENMPDCEMKEKLLKAVNVKLKQLKQDEIVTK